MVKKFIEFSPMLFIFCLALAWSTWPIAARKSGLSGNWINFATVISPAIVVIGPMIWSYLRGGTPLEAPSNVSSWLWIALCSFACTVGFVFLRDALGVKTLNVSTFMPVAQAMGPLILFTLSFLVLKEEIHLKQVIGAFAVCFGIYMLRS
jgi:uncharacterized membrane protein